MEEKDRKEFEQLKRKYTEETEESREYKKLLRLDQKVERAMLVPSLILGILGSLVLGGGMSLILSYGRPYPGIIVGLVGIVMISVSYPLGLHCKKRKKNQLRKEINMLCQKLASPK